MLYRSAFSEVDWVLEGPVGKAEDGRWSVDESNRLPGVDGAGDRPFSLFIAQLNWCRRWSWPRFPLCGSFRCPRWHRPRSGSPKFNSTLGTLWHT